MSNFGMLGGGGKYYSQPTDPHGPKPIPLARFLDTTGDGTGTKNAVGNYSGGGVGTTIFKIQPASGVIYRIERLIVHYEDTSGMTATEYGNFGAALTTGNILRIQDGSGTIVDLTDGITIKTNADWGRHCYDSDVKSWGGAAPTNDVFAARWSFFKSGTTVRLDGTANERLEMVLADNMTGLIDQYFMVQGYQENNLT